MIKNHKLFIIISLLYWLFFIIYNSYNTISISRIELPEGVKTELLERRANFLMFYHHDTSYQIKCIYLSDDICKNISKQHIVYAKIDKFNHQCGQKIYGSPQGIQQNCQANLIAIQFINQNQNIIDYTFENTYQNTILQEQKSRIYYFLFVYLMFMMIYLSHQFNHAITIDWKKFRILLNKE